MPGPPPPGVPLAPAQRPLVAPRLAALADACRHEALSDWSFTNLWLFRTAHDWRHLDGDWPCLSGRTYDGVRHVFALFPLHEAPSEVLRRLLAGHACFHPLSQAQVARLDPELFALEACRDDADYLYPASQFMHYRGRALRHKRQLMEQLHARHRVEILPFAPPLRPQALAVLDGWLRDKGKRPGEADDLPCREALARHEELGLAGWLLRADDEPAGFLLAETLQPGVDVIRFAKGLARFKGVAQALFQQHASAGAGRAGAALAWLNFEQDLGVPNFRRTKMSYQPAALLPKFRARWRPARDGDAPT